MMNKNRLNNRADFMVLPSELVEIKHILKIHKKSRVCSTQLTNSGVDVSRLDQTKISKTLESQYPD